MAPKESSCKRCRYVPAEDSQDYLMLVIEYNESRHPTVIPLCKRCWISQRQSDR